MSLGAVPSSRGLGHRPFKAAARVQIPLGPPFYNRHAGVAQQEEQRTRNAQVGGSSPPAGSIFDSTYAPSDFPDDKMQKVEPKSTLYPMTSEDLPVYIIEAALIAGHKICMTP